LAAAGILCAFLLAMAPASAKTPAAGRSDRDKADIARVEKYLNGLRTLRARFLQVSSTGGYSEGQLYIDRPGKMRIEYEPPVPILIVANGQWLIYHDKELEQVNYLALKDTPAAILVSEKVSFSNGDYTVTGFKRGPGVLRVSVAKTADLADARVTLVFSDRPLALRKWSVVDAQGVVTTVSLLGTRFGLPLNPDLFRFDDPGAGRFDESP